MQFRAFIQKCFAGDASSSTVDRIMVAYPADPDFVSRDVNPVSAFARLNVLDRAHLLKPLPLSARTCMYPLTGFFLACTHFLVGPVQAYRSLSGRLYRWFRKEDNARGRL